MHIPGSHSELVGRLSRSLGRQVSTNLRAPCSKLTWLTPPSDHSHITRTIKTIVDPQPFNPRRLDFTKPPIQIKNNPTTESTHQEPVNPTPPSSYPFDDPTLKFIPNPHPNVEIFRAAIQMAREKAPLSKNRQHIRKLAGDRRFWKSFEAVWERPELRNQLTNADFQTLMMLTYNTIEADSDERVELLRHRMREWARVFGETMLSSQEKMVRSPRGLLSRRVLNQIAHGCRKRFFTSKERALKFLEEMKEDGLRPDMVTFAILISAVGHKGNREGAIELFEMCCDEATRAHEEWKRGEYVPELNPATMRDTAEMSEMPQPPKPDLQDQEIPEYVRKGHPNAYIYSVMIMVCQMPPSPSLPLCEKYYQLAAENGYGHVPEVYGAYMNAHSTACQNTKVLQLFEAYKSEVGEPDDRMISIVIITLGQIGELQRAKDMMLEILRKGGRPTNYALNQLTMASCEQDDVEMAIFFMETLEALNAPSKDGGETSENASRLPAVSDTLEEKARSTRSSKALRKEILKRQRAIPLPLTTLELILLFRKHHRYAKAFELWEKLNAAFMPRDIHWDAYTEIMDMYIDEGNLEAAQKVQRQLEEADFWVKSNTFPVIQRLNEELEAKRSRETT
ncbi:hypothetical protein HDV05_006967 [Chytridiales sp. JEL 0842]|nr:hypothetical protein HDV05_006967 [Chytridiales sp. JEL 0842]